jgi:hypothetical protein
VAAEEVALPLRRLHLRLATDEQCTRSRTRTRRRILRLQHGGARARSTVRRDVGHDDDEEEEEGWRSQWCRWSSLEMAE